MLHTAKVSLSAQSFNEVSVQGRMVNTIASIVSLSEKHQKL